MRAPARSWMTLQSVMNMNSRLDEFWMSASATQCVVCRPCDKATHVHTTLCRGHSGLERAGHSLYTAKYISKAPSVWEEEVQGLGCSATTHAATALSGFGSLVGLGSQQETKHPVPTEQLPASVTFAYFSVLYVTKPQERTGRAFYFIRSCAATAGALPKQFILSQASYRADCIQTPPCRQRTWQLKPGECQIFLCRPAE